MINRILIRVKVVQNLYSFALTKADCTLAQAKKSLERSFEASYELYFYMLRLALDLTRLQERRLDDAKHKFLATKEDLNPNTRFIDNRVVRALAECEDFVDYCEQHLVTWSNEPIFLRLMIDKVLKSDAYQAYMEAETNDVYADYELWKQLFKNVILDDSDFEEKIEAMSVYWSTEDIEVMGQFALKTLRKLASGEPAPISPMFKDDEDKEFGETLFMTAIQQKVENSELIDSLVNRDRWDRNRIALMDRIIMCAAITELKCFDNIPTSVTLNEYIDLAKLFSTPNSGQFVNGILNAAAGIVRPKK